MRMIKRIALIIMLCSLVLSSVTVADTSNETAYKLFELNLMKGDGNGFNLDGQLKRSEAATFIVKLLGKEAEVTKNKAKYITNQFFDVKGQDWFAPYVGYCHRNGIVSGFPDGTYKPDEYVSEKAFLTMILGAMGYEAGSDFHWDNVLQKSYEKGLVEDITYAVRQEDNHSYRRSDVVSALYNTLNKEINGSKKTLVERLVDNKVTNLLVAKKYNLIRVDDVALGIESAKLLDGKTLSVELSENLADLSKDQIEVNADGARIEFVGFSMDEKSLELEFEDNLYEDRVYSVVLSNLEDEQGNSTDRLEKSFTGVEKEVVESDEFKIAFAESVTDQYIDLKFTQPITKDAEQVLLYKFGTSGGNLVEGSFRTLSASKIDDYTVRLELLDTTLSEGASYDIFVRGDIMSEYGSYLNNGDGELVSFKAHSLELDDFDITGIEVVDRKVIEVWYSRPVDEETAFDKNKYKLRDLKYNSTKTPSGIYYYQDEDGQQKDRIVLTYSTLRDDVEYELEVKDVYDEFDKNYISMYKERFEMYDMEDVRPELLDIQVMNRSMIALRFDYPLSASSNSASIYVNNNMNVAKVKVDDEDPYMLHVYFVKNRFLNDEKEYEIEVRGGLKDYLLRSPKKAIEDVFWGTNESRDSVIIENAKYIDFESILVEFSEAVRASDLTDINNYSFEYRYGKVKRALYPYEVTQITDKSVILKMDTQVEQGNLLLNVESVYEYSGQYQYEDLTYTVERWNK